MPLMKSKKRAIPLCFKESPSVTRHYLERGKIPKFPEGHEILLARLRSPA